MGGRARRATGAGAVLLALAGCSATRPDASGDRLRLGVSLPTHHYDLGAVERWEELVGRRASVVQTFVGWRYEDDEELSAFPADRVAEISAAGRAVEVTWAPQEAGGGPDQPEFDLAGIADGEHDDYVRRFAEDAAAGGVPVRLRFAHEMNGSWQPFSEVRSGNGEGDFVAAWRHVHDVVEEAGADVTWVWSPNATGPGTGDLAGLYPGDDYVDVVGIDGYSYPGEGCRSAEEVFGATLEQVRALSDRPVELAEVGVARECPDRARWVAAMTGWAAGNGVRGLTWWERPADQGDFRLAGDDDAVAALRRGVGGGADAADDAADGDVAGQGRAATTASARSAAAVMSPGVTGIGDPAARAS